MADTKPIDTLRTKDATALALTDYLIGHDDGSPAAFRTPLESLAEALAPELIPRIAPTGSNANGHWLRLGDLQVCWKRVSANPADGATSFLYPSGDTAFPQAFAEPPLVLLTAVEPVDPGHLPAGKAARYIYRDLVTTTGVRVMCLAQSGDTFTAARPLITNIVAIGRWK